MPEVSETVNAFRLASRGLFNDYFRVREQPYENGGWSQLERFVIVERLLFKQLVGAVCTADLAPYGEPQPRLLVSLSTGEFAPIMVNRDVDSGYWDHPVSEVTKSATLRFVRFFDWDQLGVCDYRYVHVVIASWPEQPGLQGRHALIESKYTTYSEA